MLAFANPLYIFELYFRAMVGVRSPLFDPHTGYEVRRRLRQLSHLAAEIERLSNQVIVKADPEGSGDELVYASLRPPGDFSEAERRERGTRPLGEEEQLHLATESFYYFAGRLLTVFDECRASLPHVPAVRAEGIRRVRNNLIEHANRKSGERVVSFALTKRTGPRLRALTDTANPEEAYVDRGFYANVADFSGSMEAAFQAALDAVTAEALTRPKT